MILCIGLCVYVTCSGSLKIWNKHALITLKKNCLGKPELLKSKTFCSMNKKIENLFIVFSPDGEPLFDTLSDSEKESTDILCRRMWDKHVYSADWPYWKSKGASVHRVTITIEVHGSKNLRPWLWPQPPTAPRRCTLRHSTRCRGGYGFRLGCYALANSKRGSDGS